MVTEPNAGRSAGKKRGRKPTREVTQHQLRTLETIQRFIDERGIPPTITDLAETLGLTRSTVQDQITQLVKKGYLNKESGRARGITVAREPISIPRMVIPVPILGEVAAGPPILAQENVVGEVLMDASILHGGSHFALEVRGDSMICAGIDNGSLVIVRQQPQAENGDIVIALIDDEATVKRLWMREDRIELRAENTEYGPIVLSPGSDLRIVGKVVAVRGKAVCST